MAQDEYKAQDAIDAWVLAIILQVEMGGTFGPEKLEELRQLAQDRDFRLKLKNRLIEEGYGGTFEFDLEF